MTAILASQLLLWLAVLVLTALVIALARQVGVLHERIAPVGALKMAQGPAIGDRAPRLDLPTLNGGMARIGATLPQGASQLLMFVSPDCPVCKNLIPIAKSFVRDERLGVVFVGDADEAGLRGLIERFGLGELPFVNSPDVGMRFGVGKLPHAVLIDSEGFVRGAGLVNTREHLESLVVAQQMGLPSVQAYLQQRAAQ